MSDLNHLNQLARPELASELYRCCGSHNWALQVARMIPFEDEESLYRVADRVWQGLTSQDWLEAFEHHPRIGGTATSAWTKEEQSGATGASSSVLEKLASGNLEYEKRFGHVFLVCATGKSADEMLALLEARIGNTPEVELKIAAGEQAKITRIRLEKLLRSTT